MGDEVGEFLEQLKSVDMGYFYYQKDNILSCRLIQKGLLHPKNVLPVLKPKLKRYNGKRVPFQGLNVGDAKNLSHDELMKITNNFSKENFIGAVGCGRLFRGVMDDGERVRDVTVKTWDFIFPSAEICADYPRKFHDEIVLLERSELKSHPFFVKLIGFCFEKKLAVVYDLKFRDFLWNTLIPDESGWKERMKVATDYALLLKTLSAKQFELSCTSDDIMIDEEYNITLINFSVNAFPQDKPHETCNGALVSDHSLMEKSYVYELGILFLELMAKRVRCWVNKDEPGLFIALRKGRSVVDDTLNVDADTSTEITQLIESCVHSQPAHRPHIDTVFDDLVRIAGYHPTLPDS